MIIKLWEDNSKWTISQKQVTSSVKHYIEWFTLHATQFALCNSDSKSEHFWQKLG